MESFYLRESCQRKADSHFDQTACTRVPGIGVSTAYYLSRLVRLVLSVSRGTGPRLGLGYRV